MPRHPVIVLLLLALVYVAAGSNLFRRQPTAPTGAGAPAQSFCAACNVMATSRATLLTSPRAPQP